jgi:hypothetical protein
MDVVAAMRVFVRVAEAGGFTPVARETHTTQPTVSRLVAALEDHLGARLFHRSTRAISLTDDGKHFYELRATRSRLSPKPRTPSGSGGHEPSDGFGSAFPWRSVGCTSPRACAISWN